MSTTPTSPTNANSGFFQISQADLKDPTCTRINRILLKLAQWAGAIYSGNPVFNSTPTFKGLSLSAQTAVPTDQTQVLTLQTATTLFGAATIRNQLVYGAPASASTGQPAVQALPYSSAANVIQSVSSLPTGLGQAGAGGLYFLTGPAHLYQWTGSGWSWGPGELGSQYCVIFPAITPSASEWHLCDGSAGVTYYKSDGTTGTVTLPNYAGATMGSTPVSAPVYYRL